MFEFRCWRATDDLPQNDSAYVLPGRVQGFVELDSAQALEAFDCLGEQAATCGRLAANRGKSSWQLRTSTRAHLRSKDASDEDQRRSLAVCSFLT